MCRHFEHLILTFAMTCALSAGQQRPIGTTPGLPAGRQEPLTDRDVIHMVESGKTEAAIVAALRSRRNNFDLSPQGCRLLAAARVSRTILNAMGNASQPPCSSTAETSKPQTNVAGPLLGNGNATLLGDGSKPTQLTAAKSGAGSPSANVTQATAAVSDYRQPPGNKGSSGPNSANQQAAGGRELAGNRNAELGDGSLHSSWSAEAPSSGAHRVALKPVKLAAPKALKKIANPHLAQTNASIIAILHQQRQAADQEASAMKLGVRSPDAATRLQAKAGVSQLRPENTQGAPGSSGYQIINKPYAEPPSIACAKDPTPRILSAPSVFTPDAKYNLFTINGCGFGATAVGNTAYIFGGNGFRENLAIDFWSDRGITAHLDPALAGVLDQNNITLVVAPAGRQAIQRSGFKFYAARGMPAPDGTDQEVQLAYNSFPHSNVAIFNVNNFIAGFDQLPSNATSNFPSFSFQGTPVAGWVFRYAYEHDDRIATFRAADCYINDVGFNGDPCQQYYAIGSRGQWQLKSDTWDLSKLAAPFQISSYQLYVSTLDPASLCASWDDLGKADAFLDGDWDFNLNAQNQIVVTWPVYRCADNEFGTRNNMMFQSAYGLAVSVMGPRCIDPWTEQKDQSCIAKVQKIFGS